jgi:apolipoprotein D and lipocalin family protein
MSPTSPTTLSTRLKLSLAAVALAALSACAAVAPGYRDTSVQISSVATLDVTRYAGLWYEIARFPVPFQEGCVGTTADYTLRPDGTIGVLNTCREGVLTGPVRQIAGEAVVVGPGRLEVKFDSVPFVSAPYWVLWVDEGYRTAVVGVPSGRAGWILNRDPQIPADRLEAARQILDFNGYDLTQLRMTPQPQR